MITYRFKLDVSNSVFLKRWQKCEQFVNCECLNVWKKGVGVGVSHGGVKQVLWNLGWGEKIWRVGGGVSVVWGGGMEIKFKSNW